MVYVLCAKFGALLNVLLCTEFMNSQQPVFSVIIFVLQNARNLLVTITRDLEKSDFAMKKVVTLF